MIPNKKKKVRISNKQPFKYISVNNAMTLFYITSYNKLPLDSFFQRFHQQTFIDILHKHLEPGLWRETAWLWMLVLLFTLYASLRIT